MRKIQKRKSELIKSVSVALRFIRSSRGLGAQDVRWTSALRGPEWNGDFPQQAKMRRVYTGALLANLQKKERKDFVYERFRKRTNGRKKRNRKFMH